MTESKLLIEFALAQNNLSTGSNKPNTKTKNQNKQSTKKKKSQKQTK